MCRRKLRPQRTPPGRHSAGFTLLELLIAVSILLILLAITATAIRVNNNVDRVRGAGRTLQSYLLGAKDRAIYAKKPRGVRFLRDETNPRTVASMVYVEPTDPWQGQVSILPADGFAANWNSATNPMRRVRLRDTNQIPNWTQLANRGLLTAGLRMRIPANSRGTWYVIQSIDVLGANQDVYLTTEIRNPVATGQLFDQAEIELPPSVVQNAEAVQLPRGVVIDLDRCSANPSAANGAGARLPPAWRVGPPVGSASFSYTNRMDLMFSPRGGVTGLAAASGVIHFYLTEQAAADLTLNAGFRDNPAAALPGGIDPATPIPDKILVSIFTRTGNVVVSPVNATDTNADGIADDPLFYSERGEVAGK